MCLVVFILVGRYAQELEECTAVLALQENT